jgi:hypothetical protein
MMIYYRKKNYKFQWLHKRFSVFLYFNAESIIKTFILRFLIYNNNNNNIKNINKEI